MSVSESAQAKILAIIRSVTAFLSLLGSLCIICIIISKRKLEKTYDRLMLGLSISDALVSLIFVFFFVMAPEEAGFEWARGNTQSCSAAGFFAQYGLAIGLYNCAISLYYVLLIRCEKTEQLIARRYEPFMHGISISFPLVTAIVGVALQLFNAWESGVGCWFEEYPIGCTGSECERGAMAWLFAWLFAGIPVVLMIIFLTVNYILIYCKVRKQETRNRRHSFLGRSTQESIKRKKAVAVQAALYTGVFLNTFLWPVLTEAIKHYGGRGGFVLAVLTQIFYPAQGAFNFFIYIRPRYNAWRERHPTKTRLWALKQVVVSKSNPNQKSVKQVNESSSGEQRFRKARFFALRQATGSRGSLKGTPPEEAGTNQNEFKVEDGNADCEEEFNNESMSTDTEQKNDVQANG